MKVEIKNLVESKRFVEALYFGTQELFLNPSPDLHLYLGLACCGAIRPIAEFQRYMAYLAQGKEVQRPAGGLILKGNTTIVYEGFQHLIEARHRNSSIKFPDSMNEAVKEVLNDLGDYLTQEFHGYQSTELKYSLRTSAIAAAVVLTRLTDTEVNLPKNINDSMRKSGEDLIVDLENSKGGDASFYKLIK